MNEIEIITEKEKEEMKNPHYIKKKRVLSLLIWIIIGVNIALILSLTFVLGSFSQNINVLPDTNKIIIFNTLKSHIVDNNLELLDKKLIDDSWFSDRNLYEFHSFVEINYKYSENEYDCKYWAFIWSLYSLKHNIDFRYVLLDSHIFVILEFEDKYCLADGKKLDCNYFK